jgi:X-Pro dipeptidyl-peptidase
MARRLAALPVLALALAGCAAPAVQPTLGPAALDPLTQPVFALGEFIATSVEGLDGVTIHVDLQLPDGPGPWPVIVQFTPYSLTGSDERWAALRERGLDGPLDQHHAFVEAYVPLGYAVGIAHVRGTGESEGCLTVGGPEEGEDGYRLVEFLASQPWSNGKVAMMGTSWVGTTPIETAVLAPPHLTTIVPISPVTEWYRYYFEKGAHRVNGDPPPGSSATDPAVDAALSLPPGPRTLRSDPLAEAQCLAEFTYEYEVQDDYDAYWEARDIEAGVANVTVPVLYAQGWKDENVATSMIPDFWSALQSEKRAFLAQHGHGVPGNRAYFHDYVHRWLDHFLLGKQNGALDLAPVVVEDNLGRWRAEPTWPPPNLTAARLWLAPGALASEAPAEGSASYLDDGTGRQDAALEGIDHLRFESEPLPAPLHVAGVPFLHLQASSDQPRTLFAALLYDRAPDGGERLVTRGYIDARHRESLEQGKDMPAGRSATVAWELHPRDHVVEEGHRLVLVVKSSDAYVMPSPVRARNTLLFGAEGSWLELPLASDAGKAFLDEAPVPG